MMDCYLILGLAPDASGSQINRAYRSLSHHYDPDRVGEAASGRFDAVSDAYHVLRDSARRAEHDRELMRQYDEGAATPRAIGEPIDLFGGFETYRPEREELLDRWEQNFTRRHLPKSNPARELNVEVLLSPAQAKRGGSIPIDVPVARVCPRCEGTGSAGYATCDLCDGHGMEWETARVDVLLSPGVRDGTTISVPLRHLGVQNFYLRLHARVAA